MQNTEAEKKEIKRRFQLWIRPSTLDLADSLPPLSRGSTQGCAGAAGTF